jgi:hypothetical protein
LRQFAVSARLWDFVSHRAVTPKKASKNRRKAIDAPVGTTIAQLRFCEDSQKAVDD